MLHREIHLWVREFFCFYVLSKLSTTNNIQIGTIVTSDDDDELRSELDSWGYNCFEYDDEALLTQAVTMIAMMKFDIQFNVRVPVMRRFAIEIRKQYLNNPYHNFRHGVDVMQSVFWMSRKIDFERHLPSVEMFALLTAALSHDVGHPGTNNAFLVNTSSPLALRYNDLSVLENMHASIMFITMGGKSEEDNTMNIFSGMSKTDFIIARKTAIKSILMTDNSHHFKCINDIKVMLEVHQDKHERGDSIFIDSEKQRMFLCGLLLHVSDISNPMRHWKASSKAAFNVMEEFFLQGDQEKKRNMKVSMLCDREKENIPKSQMGFIDFFVSPLTEQFLNLFPECGTDFATELVANRLRWQNMYITTLDAKEQDVKGKELREKYDGWKKKWETYLDDGHEVADVKVDEEAMGTMQKLKSGLVKRMSIVKMMGSGSSSGNSRSNSGEKK
jgi:high affinity cGMP-specific 3',5'-cyclic phosphodiesterase 9